MIVVVADDLTGAAELAGIAWSHGLTAEVQTEFSAETTADVVALDVKSRDVSAEIAVKWTAAAFRSVAAAQPEWIYKKCDSVLRGHVAEEIEAALAVTGLPRALLIPANPSRRRVIRGGEYFVGDRPLSETDFARDPHYPRRTSSVADLLGGRVKLLAEGESIGSAGIFVPNITTESELSWWASQADERTLPAGAADFFGALLARRTSGTQLESRFRPPIESVSTLFVCGSAMAWRAGRKNECGMRDVPVFMVSKALSSPIQQAILELTQSPAVMIGSPPEANPNSSELHDALIEVACEVIRHSHVERICVEGGATALRLATLMDWRRFEVVREWAMGVVELRPIGSGRAITMIVKVGSYDWPDDVWP